MTTAENIADPVLLVNSLDPDAIRERLDALDRERGALMVLLRAALRVRKEPAPAREGGEVPDAP
jgi:hypothetical protein